MATAVAVEEATAVAEEAAVVAAAAVVATEVSLFELVCSCHMHYVHAQLLGDRGGYGGGGGGGGGARGPSVFVGNIPWAATENELRDLFSGCGQVNQFRILVDRETNRSRGNY